MRLVEQRDRTCFQGQQEACCHMSKELWTVTQSVNK